MNDRLLDSRFNKIGNTDYYLYNPYYEAFQDYYYTSINEVNNDNQLIFEMFCSSEKDRLKRNIESVDENIKKKYEVENDLLKEFINNFPKNGLLY